MKSVRVERGAPVLKFLLVRDRGGKKKQAKSPEDLTGRLIKEKGGEKIKQETMP